jgi:hypothetical protein
MTPIKGKKYMINCQGPYDYNRYMGEGICTGGVDRYDPEQLAYGFKIPDTTEICFFLEEEIVAEFDNGVIKEPEEIQSQIDSENNYCETCDSCGETGCCPPINCQAVKCKYGEINLKDYECFQNQWEIMFNALKDIGELDYGAAGWPDIAKNALNAVDKEWDKLYSKE